MEQHNKLFKNDGSLSDNVDFESSNIPKLEVWKERKILPEEYLLLMRKYNKKQDVFEGRWNYYHKVYLDENFKIFACGDKISGGTNHCIFCNAAKLEVPFEIVVKAISYVYRLPQVMSSKQIISLWLFQSVCGETFALE